MFANTRETLFGTIVLLLSSSCSIICGVACDLVEEGECLSEGQLFGPCTPALTCDPLLTCAHTDVGTICLPPAAAAEVVEVAECAAWRGTMSCSEKDNRCVLACDGNDDCEGGTVCDEYIGMCMYPHDKTNDTDGDMCFEAGEDFGPCHDGKCGSGLFCRNTTSGNICVPACSLDHCNSECAADIGTTCDASGACVLACEPDKADCGRGQVCDSQTRTCVWPNKA